MYQAVGKNIIVEVLSLQEMLGTSLEVVGDANKDINVGEVQSYGSLVNKDVSRHFVTNSQYLKVKIVFEYAIVLGKSTNGRTIMAVNEDDVIAIKE